MSASVTAPSPHPYWTGTTNPSSTSTPEEPPPTPRSEPLAPSAASLTQAQARGMALLEKSLVCLLVAAVFAYIALMIHGMEVVGGIR